jgi:thymidylate synthase
MTKEITKKEDTELFLGNIAEEIIDEFEVFLSDKGIQIPNEERDSDSRENPDDIDNAMIYGSDYYTLEDSIKGILARRLSSFTNAHMKAIDMINDMIDKIKIKNENRNQNENK